MSGMHIFFNRLVLFMTKHTGIRNLSEITTTFRQLICRNKAGMIAVHYVVLLTRNERTRSLPKSLRIQLTLIELHYRSAWSVVCGPCRPSAPLSFTFTFYEIASHRFYTRPRLMHSLLDKALPVVS